VPAHLHPAGNAAAVPGRLSIRLPLTAEFTGGFGDGKGGVGSRDIGPRYSKARANITADARDMLGGNGVLLGYQVAWHMADLEAIHTFEGTETMQTLIVGGAITGIGPFA
jgi:hypothetical protein